jgi:error-prone DNA polymerase
MPQPAAVQLAVATPWSFHHGASAVEELARAAAARGIGALGLADRNGLWGAVYFQRACQTAGVRPIFGMRLEVEGVQAQVLARDAAGWAALCRLTTRFHLEEVARLAPGIGRSVRLLSWLHEERARAPGSFVVLARDAELLRALGGGRAGEGRGATDLYVAARPGALAADDAELAADLGLEAAAAPPVAFTDRVQYARHRLLAAIGANENVSRLDEARDPAAEFGLVPKDAWLRDEGSLAAAYAGAPRALAVAAELGASCDFTIPLGQKRMPRTGLGAGAIVELKRRCLYARERRFLTGPEWDERGYAAQLARELKLIREQDLADYFLIVEEIAAWAQAQGIQNCGRGSAANSLVSYLLGFTHVDPLRHGLWFDRFLNAGRADFPDVDLDFAWDERDRVLDFVYRRHGRDRAAMLGTHVTFGVRGAVREIAKAMGVPAAEIGPITRALPWAYDGSLDLERIRDHPRTARLPLDAEPWRTILQEAYALRDFPRHLGVHAGGMVIAPGPLTDHLPLQLARKETEDGRVVITQWDMYPVEDAGLLKMDLLGNRGLAVIRDATAAVAQHHGLAVDFARVDAEQDLRTRDLLARGDTMGCFYVESPSMRGLLTQLKCRDFATLVAASSIIRPGISSSGMMQAYVERHLAVMGARGRHEESWYLDPRLRELLGETYGVMAYQEDVLRVAQNLAGMSAAEADALRKAMTHKRSQEAIGAFGARFTAGAIAHGAAPAAAEELWRQIESFSGYSFCKAHSASYAQISYRSTWLRAHFPAEFMAAVLGNHGGYYSTFAYLAEARRMGLRLLLPCVNAGAASFSGGGRKVRVGLSEIRSLSPATLARCLAARAKGGEFLSLEDFCLRVRPQPHELDSLARAGALDALPDGLTRPERLRWAALAAPDLRRRAAAGAAGSGGALLFGETPLRRPPSAPEFPALRQLELEEDALGYLVSAHPLALWQDRIRAAGVVPARELAQHLGRRVRLVGWQVTQKPLRTAGGEPMMFISFEDTTAIYETVMFPQAYRRLAPWTLTQGPYLIEGVPKDENGALTVDVRELQLLRDVPYRRERAAR